MNDHAAQQKAVIDRIEAQIKSNSLGFTVVPPMEDYESDPRICLTIVHLLKTELVEKIQQSLLTPLREIEPDYYYYPAESLHTTIKNIRTIEDPPNFSSADVQTAQKVLTEITPRHFSYKIYFYRLLLFPNNLALIGTTDPQLDDLVLDLDRTLTKSGIPDNKTYANSKYFFCNITLARFDGSPSEKFKAKAQELSDSLAFKPYLVDSISLITGNAVFHDKKVWGTWKLKE